MWCMDIITKINLVEHQTILQNYIRIKKYIERWLRLLTIKIKMRYHKDAYQQNRCLPGIREAGLPNLWDSIHWSRFRKICSVLKTQDHTLKTISTQKVRGCVELFQTAQNTKQYNCISIKRSELCVGQWQNSYLACVRSIPRKTGKNK